MVGVAKEYPNAAIDIHIPPNPFVPASIEENGQYFKQIGESLGLEVRLSHEFFSVPGLIRWLAGHHLNAFFFEYCNMRGISSSIDQGVAARRPIAINECFMFRHVGGRLGWYPHKSIRQSYEENGPIVEEIFKEWSQENFDNCYSSIVDKIIGK